MLIAGSAVFYFINDARRPAGDPGQLRRLGNFREAERAAKIKYKETKDPRYLDIMLGIIEDTGNSKRLIKTARQCIKEYPNNNTFKWYLGKALLFAAATFPDDKQFEEWVKEAETITDELEKNQFTDPEVPGTIPILKMEAAFLRQNWTDADKYAVQALELGTTTGETGDLYQLRFDTALRENRKEDAIFFMDKALESVEEASKSSYYGLRAFREEALAVKDIFFDIEMTNEKIDDLVKLHNDILQKGLFDPTDPEDKEYHEVVSVLRKIIELRNEQNHEALIQLAESCINASPTHSPRCFFSEAVATPFRNVYINFAAGKSALTMKDYDKAEHFFNEALKAHPKDKMIEEKLKEIEVLKNQPLK